MTLTSRSIPRIVLMLVLALVVISMIVPSSALDFLRIQYDWVDSVIDFVFSVVPGIDIDHLLAFGVLGFVAHFGWPRGRAVEMVIGCAALAALVEVIQIWVPGREPALAHAVLDVIGGSAGFGLAWVLTYAWGKQSLPETAGEAQRRPGA